MAEKNNTNSRHTPKTAIGRFMVYHFVPQYANNVMGLVYIGAAVLIIIVGLRGLGTSVGGNAMVPGFLIGDDGRIMIEYVMGALFLEFGMLLILAFVTFFTPEEEHTVAKGEVDATGRSMVSGQELRDSVHNLKSLTEDELRMIEGYLERFDKIANKINDIQRKNLEALNNMKHILKS